MKSFVSPSDAVGMLSGYGASLFLVSAYDIAKATERERDQLIADIANAREAGATVLLDSGKYESYWLRDKTWTVKRFHSILAEVPVDIAFMFDTRDGTTVDEIVEATLRALHRDQERAGDTLIAPVVHLPEGGEHFAADIVPRIMKAVTAPIVAIPERELGDGLSKRVKTVQHMRQAIDQTGVRTPLHLLGTGNPLSLLAFAVAGADSFDGLEWCQTVVDHNTALLHHHQHYEFFRHQTSFGDGRIPYPFSVLAHNLVFFSRWIAGLREHVIGMTDLRFQVERMLPSDMPTLVRKGVLDCLPV